MRQRKDAVRTFLSDLGALKLGQQPIHCVTVAVGREQNFLWNDASNPRSLGLTDRYDVMTGPARLESRSSFQTRCSLPAVQNITTVEMTNHDIGEPCLRGP